MIIEDIDFASLSQVRCAKNRRSSIVMVSVITEAAIRSLGDFAATWTSGPIRSSGDHAATWTSGPKRSLGDLAATSPRAPKRPLGDLAARSPAATNQRSRRPRSATSRRPILVAWVQGLKFFLTATAGGGLFQKKKILNLMF